MRRFLARDGSEWEAAVGRESWGTFVLLFTGPTGPRKSLLASETQLEAQRELEEYSEDTLRERLARSEPWG
jgi:hypothetical protein